MLNFFIYLVGGIIIGLLFGFMALLAASFLHRYVDKFQDEAKVEEEPNPRKATFVSTTQDDPSGMKEFLERNKK
ncbi:MAG: hypothetical protein KGJ89_05155 [Patescibacteria group bacterium]|nr:hypothetical protein [Patescibacteria group bacterium]MDE2227310.1 hypothetical protein [Patescibacteria group bacterium]